MREDADTVCVVSPDHCRRARIGRAALCGPVRVVVVRWAWSTATGVTPCHAGARASACVKLIPQEDAAKFTDLYWDKVDWKTGSPPPSGRH
jgi:hypothetical protein